MLCFAYKNISRLKTFTDISYLDISVLFKIENYAQIQTVLFMYI